MAVPVINYSPETNWEFGAAAQAYFELPDQRTSIVQVDGAYSLNRQWYTNTQGTLYISAARGLRLSFKAGYRDYPYTYYGIGNLPTIDGSLARKGERYLSKRAFANIQPLFTIAPHCYLGGQVDLLWERVEWQSSSSIEKVLMPGIGLTLQYDTRDVTYYPNQGWFIKASVTHYNKIWGATRSLTTWQADCRQFWHLGHSIVWANEVMVQMALSSEAAPFQMLPTIGGQDLIRGVPYGMFRDNTAIAYQTELRVPIWNIIRACAFFGIGDVYDYHHPIGTTPKIGYGLGLRLAINKAKINIRADIARNNLYSQWNEIRGYGFYLTATEAF